MWCGRVISHMLTEETGHVYTETLQQSSRYSLAFLLPFSYRLHGYTSKLANSLLHTYRCGNWLIRPIDKNDCQWSSCWDSCWEEEMPHKCSSWSYTESPVSYIPFSYGSFFCLNPSFGSLIVVFDDVSGYIPSKQHGLSSEEAVESLTVSSTPHTFYSTFSKITPLPTAPFTWHVSLFLARKLSFINYHFWKFPFSRASSNWKCFCECFYRFCVHEKCIHKEKLLFWTKSFLCKCRHRDYKKI